MSPSIGEAYSIFQQPWWLEATAPGRWDEVCVEEGGKVVARLPFTIDERFGFRYLGQPRLTQNLGPWIESRSGERPDRRLAREKDLFTKLVGKLPTHDLFLQNFSPLLTNWLPFYWMGFAQTTRYTYVVDTSSSVSQLRSNFSKSARKQLSRAESKLEVTDNAPLDVLLDLNRRTFGRQGLRVPYSESLVHRIDEAVRKHGHRDLLVATDRESGEPHAAAYMVGDSSRIYALISGGDPKLRESGAGYLLKWESIQRAKALSAPFDLEGSMIEDVEQFYRRLGASQTPYSSISRRNIKGTVALAGRTAAAAVQRRVSQDMSILRRR